MNWECWFNLVLVWVFGIGWSLTLWRWRMCARALHQCQAQRAKLEWQLAVYRRNAQNWVSWETKAK